MNRVVEFLKGEGTKKVCVVGLGYVGLPLAVLLDSKFSVIGFDISQKRVDELINGKDRTREVSENELRACNVKFTCDPSCISEAELLIVTVPTPIDENFKPDASIVESASRTCGKYMKEGTIVVYESTVYPGLTEEICVPILEAESGMKWKEGFNVGYSPERVNPGDKVRTIDKIVKIVSGDTPEVTSFLSAFYGRIVTAGIHIAETIKIAEAAKVLENTQRDVNIALMNEVASICDKLDIDTNSVLRAAGTKWNFLNFTPGLVGGHCIGVDPYYLTHKAQELGVDPKLILSGREVNERVSKFVTEKVIGFLKEQDKEVTNAKTLIMGMTFKEDCPDIRNTKVIDVYKELVEAGADVSVYDPEAIAEEVEEEFGINLVEPSETDKYDVIILAVKHASLKDKIKGGFILKSLNDKGVVVDVKGIINKPDTPENSVLWRL